MSLGKVEEELLSSLSALHTISNLICFLLTDRQGDLRIFNNKIAVSKFEHPVLDISVHTIKFAKHLLA